MESSWRRRNRLLALEVGEITVPIGNRLSVLAIAPVLLICGQSPAFAQSKYYDLGDLKTETPLPERHAIAQNEIYSLQKQNIRTISFGGGHDYGYSDASGFLKAHLGKDVKPIVLNFDRCYHLLQKNLLFLLAHFVHRAKVVSLSKRPFLLQWQVGYWVVSLEHLNVACNLPFIIWNR